MRESVRDGDRQETIREVGREGRDKEVGIAVRGGKRWVKKDWWRGRAKGGWGKMGKR